MKFLINYLKGVAVGLATLVPGVSGGTMAIIFGIYDELLHSIGFFFKDWKKHTLFLLQVGLGGLTGLVVFSSLLKSAVETFPYEMRFLFIGIICGGIPVLYKRAGEGRRDIKGWIFLLIGLIIVLLMPADEATTATLATTPGIGSMMFLFIAGIVMAIALILPGISGSYMLLILGLYDVTLGAIENRSIPFLIPLALGILVGTLATTRLIEGLLKKYPSIAYMLILGFVAGSIKPVFEQVGFPTGYSIISSIVTFALGFMLIRWISKKDIEA
ncbi:DUF368 domain-containing protein [Clostridium thermarum]|uniref:DUF368 domain-containing protein n=1 Tax=Clostridium thermarum TaxID=1716543 RepID=UPI0013D86DED|nr:DUF368 domain-containing protein [Clostridium thermarum]